MRQFCLLALLTLLSSSAGMPARSRSLVGGRRIHIKSSRYCRSSSCSWFRSPASYNRAANAIEWRTAEACCGSCCRADARGNSARDHSGRCSCAPAAGRLQAGRCCHPDGCLRRFSHRLSRRHRRLPCGPRSSCRRAPPPPPVAKPIEAVRPSPTARVSPEVADEPADTPLGDWQTEGQGHRCASPMRPRAVRLCRSTHRRTTRAKRC